jgi:hypothetical protein
MEFDDHPWLVECSRTVERAGKRGDHGAQLEACWTLGARVARAVLRQIGEKPPSDATVLDQISLAQDLARERQDQFPGLRSSMPPWLELPGLHRAMYWIEESRKSGIEETRLPGSPYWYRDQLYLQVLNAAFQLISAMTLPEVTTRTEVPLSEGYAIVEDEVLIDRPVSETMESVVRRLSGTRKSSIWSRLRRLPYRKEIEAYRPFLGDLVRREPPPFALQGLWFGIGSPIRDGRTTIDAYVFGSDVYDPDDEEWAQRADWEPRSSDLSSGILSNIHEIGRRRDAPSLGADFVALAYSCVLARELTRAYKQDAGLDRIGAAAGFDSGDIIHLGWL